jgi:hypothetical protein
MSRRCPAGTVHGEGGKLGVAESVPHGEVVWMLEKIGCFSGSIVAAVDDSRDDDKIAPVIN